MKNQQGAALIVVLVLLAISLMLGLSSVQSSLMGERMSGNYREHTLAYNEAEAGIFHVAEEIRLSMADGVNIEGLLLAGEALNLELAKDEVSLTLARGAVNPPLGHHEVKVILEAPLAGRRSLRLVSNGYYGSEGRQAWRQMTGLIKLPEQGPVGLMACENLALRGGGLIDSYDSSAGPYGDGNKERSNATIGTMTEGATTSLAGSRVYGQVRATGNLIMEGSSTVAGSIKANGDLTMAGSSTITGGLLSGTKRRISGNVEVGGSAEFVGAIHGDVRAAQKITLKNGSSISGDVTAKTLNLLGLVIGTVLKVEDGPEVAAVDSVADSRECDDFDVPAYQERFEEIDKSCSEGDCYLHLENGQMVMSKNGIYNEDGDRIHEAKPMTIGGLDVHVVRLDRFKKSGSNSKFTVGTVEDPVNMVMIVDGSTTIEGGEFSISPGSTLQVVTEGKFYASAHATLTTEKQPSVNDDGKVWPALSLFSTYKDNEDDGNPGVVIGGQSDFYGLVSAPFSKVTLGGQGHIYGAVNAREIDFVGGGFHYDERLGEMASLLGDGPPVPRLVSLYEIFTH